MKNTTVRQSPIQGKGVFAERNFKKGEIILEIDDAHIVDDFDKLTEEEKEFQCDWLGDTIVLMQSPERYINHSCDPNSYVKTVNGIRTLFAMKAINKGDEITYDYAVNGYYETHDTCNCGTPNCRKILNCDFFQLPQDIQKKYKPYLDDWFVDMFQDKLGPDPS